MTIGGLLNRRWRVENWHANLVQNDGISCMDYLFPLWGQSIEKSNHFKANIE